MSGHVVPAAGGSTSLLIDDRQRAYRSGETLGHLRTGSIRRADFGTDHLKSAGADRVAHGALVPALGQAAYNSDMGGPILLFDKSTLEGLSVDEAVWLDAHYSANITPLFFVETLADLEKEIVDGRTPEQVVGNLAEKTPDEGQPNVHHATLCVNELLGGGPVEMRGAIILAGGESVESGGRRGVVFKESPEMAALRRWQARQFLDVERRFAQVWRKALSGLDMDAIYREGRGIIERFGRPRHLLEAKALAVALHEKPGSRCTREALHGVAVPEDGRREIVDRWRAAGEPPITHFAPFTAHVLTVDTFFNIAVGADLISRERPSNKVDIAYLYYLPFSMVFTSNDNLHARTAPLFLGERQVFVRGQELKVDLSRLDEHYSAFPEEVKEQGVISFAAWPPPDGDFLTCRIWDKTMRPDWRDVAKQPGPTLSEKQGEEIVARVNQMAKAPRTAREFTSEDADAIVLQRYSPVRKGKWRLLSQEAVEAASKRRGEEQR